MSDQNMTIHLKIWKQKNAETPGTFEDYTVDDVNPDMSFLEMLDWLNERLMNEGKEPVEFDHDCREGICGSCNLVLNGMAHGPFKGTAVCQLHMRKYNDGDTIVVEPWRARAFPMIRDLVVDRSALDRIMAAGGYISVNTGAPADANALPIDKYHADLAFDYAACIGCGACVAACPNSSASLFTSAKIAQLAHLPQGTPERQKRVVGMVNKMQEEGFGDCSNYAECEAVCPAEISITAIAEMRREYMKALREV
ncbi:succinate dehydrogenase/fumarate reductase iron-sulfur subunit [Balneolaceae bacterium ANBcel3]|nr:succinate dehydrogenase/fumarate reductase iron-sulfur subunit [Balneolaceae bacterium ANBcel3]